MAGKHNLLFMNTREKLSAFMKAYGLKLKVETRIAIDWTKVAAEYQGVIIAPALAFANVDDHPLAVDVGDLQIQRLLTAQACAVVQGQQRPVLDVHLGIEQGADYMAIAMTPLQRWYLPLYARTGVESTVRNADTYAARIP